jgi:hypothetical protein
VPVEALAGLGYPRRGDDERLYLDSMVVVVVVLVTVLMWSLAGTGMLLRRSWSFAAQADRLRGQEDAAQHDCQPVKHETRGAKGTNEKDETEGAELIRNWTYMLVLICVNHRTSQASRLPTRVPGSWSSVRTEKRQPEASKQAGCESDTIRPKWCGVV